MESGIQKPLSITWEQNPKWMNTENSSGEVLWLSLSSFYERNKTVKGKKLPKKRHGNKCLFLF